jgi:hypothetical protein
MERRVNKFRFTQSSKNLSRKRVLTNLNVGLNNTQVNVPLLTKTHNTVTALMPYKYRIAKLDYVWV